eukprot:489246_1
MLDHIDIDDNKYPSNDESNTPNQFLKCNICLKLQLYNKFIQLTNCNHIICKDCLYNYVKSNLKNISKYSMQCFHKNCVQLLHSKDVQKAFKDRKVITHKLKRKKTTWQRIECPNCKCKMEHFMQHKEDNNVIKSDELKKTYTTIAHCLKINELEIEYKTNLIKGLTTEYVNKKILEIGYNELTRPEYDPIWLRYLKSVFGGFFNILLWIGALLCFISYT